MLIRKSEVSRRESGMSMIELIVAMTLLAVGMCGLMILISTAIASNNRNKLDTTATNLSQMILERLAAQGAASTSPFTITDCASNVLTVDPSGSTGGRGAALYSSGLNNGNIDFSVDPNPTSGYSVNYVTCSASERPATYNIRWNVKILEPQTGSSSPVIKQIAVASQQVGGSTTGASQLKFFAPPVTLKTVIGR